MQIQLLSDLHLEFDEWEYQATNADVVVLAGDIHLRLKGIEWANHVIPDKPVIYVAGNHEYYGKAWPSLLEKMRAAATNTNVHLLENESITINGVEFFGCTLWTDFELLGDPRIAGYHCQQIMNDYKKIRRSPGYSKLRSIDVASIHKQSRRWLENALTNSDAERKVVITHHAPSALSLREETREDLIRSAYASNLEPLIHEHKPSLWLHGHLHNSSDYRVEQCRVVCNPKGYPGKENPRFKPELLIEI